MKQTLLAIAALLVIAGCGEDEPTAPGVPDEGETRVFEWYGEARVVPCTQEDMDAYCVTRGYHKAVDWVCANTDDGFKASEITCWRP